MTAFITSVLSHPAPSVHRFLQTPNELNLARALLLQTSFRPARGAPRLASIAAAGRCPPAVRLTDRPSDVRLPSATFSRLVMTRKFQIIRRAALRVAALCVDVRRNPRRRSDDTQRDATPKLRQTISGVLSDLDDVEHATESTRHHSQPVGQPGRSATAGPGQRGRLVDRVIGLPVLSVDDRSAGPLTASSDGRSILPLPVPTYIVSRPEGD